MKTLVIRGRGAIRGVAEGRALVSRHTIQGWNGVDIRTGLIIEKGHPFEGMSIKGSVLVLAGGKGSNGWSCHFHAARVAGVGPAAMVLPRIDSRTAVAAVMMDVPVVTDLEADPFELIRTGDFVRVDGDRGIVEIFTGND